MSIVHIIFDGVDMEENPIPGEEAARARIKDIRTLENVVQIGVSERESDDIAPEQLIEAIYNLDSHEVTVYGSVKGCEHSGWYLREMERAGLKINYDETGCV